MDRKLFKKLLKKLPAATNYEVVNLRTKKVIKLTNLPKPIKIFEDGFMFSNEARENMSMAKQGVKRKPFTEETRERMRNSSMRRWGHK